MRQRIAHNKLSAVLVAVLASAPALGTSLTTTTHAVAVPPVLELAILPPPTRLESRRRYEVFRSLRSRLWRQRRARKLWRRPRDLHADPRPDFDWDARGAPRSALR